MKIITVLKSGGDYRPEHVNTLQQALQTYSTITTKFVCYTDTPDELEVPTAPLQHGLPGWWSKMEIFKEPGPCLFLDLDTIIRGDIAPVIEKAKGHPFVAVRDFYRGVIDKTAVQSSLMYWEGDLSYLTENFLANPIDYGGGDQIYIQHHVEGPVAFWQDLTPYVKSFKVDIVPKETLDDTDRIIVFHGRPRPWEQYLIPYPGTGNSHN